MESLENLTPEEEQHINNQITAALFDAEHGGQSFIAPGTPPDLTDSFFADIRNIAENGDRDCGTVGEQITLDGLPDPDQITDEEDARIYIRALLLRLNEARVHLDDRPFHLSAVEFYRWLHRVFLTQAIDFPPGGGWHTHFSFADLEPRSPQNMFSCLRMFITSLVDLERELDAWLLTAATYEEMEAQAPAGQGRFLRSWRAGFRELELLRLTPRLPCEQTGDRAILPFEIAYRGRREDGSPVQYAGPGKAVLNFADPSWDISVLRFPGFHLREEPT